MGSVVDDGKKEALQEAHRSLADLNPTVVFVLGGPGSGKGTQCANIVEHFGFTHLSAGDLLRAEIKSGSENGTMISDMIKEGKIVPSEVTIKLLERAMLENGNDKFLIDGFPRNEENRAAFEDVTKIGPSFVLYFDCSEEEMERRLLSRNQGREDDNIETIRKRFKVFQESSLPVIEYYNSKGKVRKIDAGRPIEEVYESVKAIFAPKDEKVNGHRHTLMECLILFWMKWCRVIAAIVTKISDPMSIEVMHCWLHILYSLAGLFLMLAYYRRLYHYSTQLSVSFCSYIVVGF
ncbi:hypothetical protein ACFX19_041001 [Malus domestica]